MKLTTFIILISLMQVSASTFGQKMTLVERSVSIEKVLMEIRKQTGYDVLIIDTKFDLKKQIKADFNAAPLELVMDRIVSGTNFTYKIDEKNVVLKQKEQSFLDRVIDRFAAIDVRGIVVDENGNPLPGASVKVKGVNKVTKTDAEGEFFLQGVDDDAVLQISYVGYKTQEIEALSNLGVIKMEVDDSELEEITVSTGYWTVDKRKNVGNISKVTAKDIENQPVTSPLMALQGRMPGVEIIPTSGAPGSSVKIQIRGQNSLRNGMDNDAIDGNLPLYIVDGIPINSTPVSSNSASLIEFGFDPLSTINPANIESIQVLKDADATAIYGSRGANGVILITTKSQRNSKGLHATASVYRGAGKVVDRVDMLSREEYLMMRREAITNDGGDAELYYNDAVLGPFFYPDLLSWDTTRSTNWQGEILDHSSGITDLQFNVSGGSGRTTIGAGGSYHKETLLYPGDFGHIRYSGSLNMNHSSLDGKFNLSFNTNYGAEDHKLFDSDFLLNNTLALSPVAPNPYNTDGTLNWAPVFGVSTFENPWSSLRRTHVASTHNIIVNSVVGYELPYGFGVKTNMGFSRYDHDEILNVPISSLNPFGFGPFTGRSQLSGSGRTSWIFEPQLTYKKKLGDHSVNSLFGISLQQNHDQLQTFDGTGYTSDAMLGNLSGAPKITNSGSGVEYRYGAAFMRLGYEYKGKYLINASGRRDGSSRFGPGKRYGDFGAIGVGWIFSEERLLSAFSVLSFGKIRASYGVTGNDQIGDSKYIKSYQPASGTYYNSIGLLPTELYNPDYAWEKTRKFEAAVELGFFNDRISFTLATFRNRSSNQLIRYQLPAATGFSDVLTNFDAVVENTGLEYSVMTKNIDAKSFKWTTTFNLSALNNRLVHFDKIDESPYATTFKVGEPLSITRSYVWTGVDPVKGIHTFKDLNGDGGITSDDQDFSKALTTQYFGGIGNDFSYLGFNINFLVQFTDRYVNTFYFPTPGILSNQPVSVLKRWQKPGDDTKIQRFSTTGDALTAYTNYTSSDAQIERISFARLKTFSLSYTIPQKTMKKAGVGAAKIFIQGQNLFTLTDFEGWDPETVYGVPPLKIISGGIQIKF